MAGTLFAAGPAGRRGEAGMNGPGNNFDFWYAVNNTEIMLLPPGKLETFGATILNYHLVSELMDTVSQVRVREGRIQAYRPQIITPESYAQAILEGFGEEAEKYVEWLKEKASEVYFVQYGFKIRKEEFNEHVVTDNVRNVAERVEKEVREKGDPLGAVVLGVDKPWEVSLIKLMVAVSFNSRAANIRDFKRRKMLGQTEGVPNFVHMEIEEAFLAAARDRSLIGGLAQRLEKHGLFEKYQDRFFALIRTAK